MLIRMIVGLSGPTMTLEPGNERDFPQAEAVRLIAAGFAVPVAEQEIERAVLQPQAETRFTSVLKLPESSVHERRMKRNRR